MHLLFSDKMAEGGSPSHSGGPAAFTAGPPDIIPHIIPVDLGQFLELFQIVLV